MSSGFDEFTLQIYSVSKSVEEALEDNFKIKVSDELVGLVDQLDHVKFMAGKSIGVKLIIKWQYDSDIEKLSDLQQK